MDLVKENIKGFDKGYSEMVEMYRQFRKDLKEALDVKSAVQLSHYRHGKTRMNNPRVLAVKAVFEKYGVDQPFDLEE